MPATWSSPQRNISITHSDNLLPYTFTFPSFADFQEIFLPCRCKHLFSHSNNIHVCIYTPSYVPWFQYHNSRRPVGKRKESRSMDYTGMSKKNHLSYSPLNGIMSFPCICLMARHIHGTMYRVASICLA